MQIAVIGAGVGGLVTAIGLQRDGHEVSLFERREDAGGTGAGLSLFGNSFLALDTLGLGDLVRSVSSDEIAWIRSGHRRPNGRWLTRIPRDAMATLRTMHRGDLHRALVGELADGTLRTGCDAIVSAPRAPWVTADGRMEDYDLVIAADGLHSPNRARLGLDPGLRYAGYVAWRGVTSGPVDLGGSAGVTWGRGRHFGMAPLPGDRVYWFATLNTPAGGANDNEHAEVRRLFAGWHSPIAELLDATDPDTVLRHDIEDLSRPLPTFVRERTVLLGDAAHGMTPDLGQGAGQVIEDAATLVLTMRTARGTVDVPGVLERYDALRIRRTRRMLLRSRRAGRLSRMDGHVVTTVRNAVMRVTPGSVVGRTLGSLIAWVPPEPSAR